MRLSRKIDQALIAILVLSIAFIFGTFLTKTAENTFAESETEAVEQSDTHHVIFYDDGKRLIIKTTAETVREALERAKISINGSDIVEPGLDAKIDSDNFYVNIYRARPALVKDGVFEKYIMTASFDKKNIASEAGFVVYDGDEVKNIKNSNFLEMGVADVYQIIRNGGRTLTVEEEIPFTEKTEKDYNLAPGTMEVRQLGEVGSKKKIFEVFYVNNVEVSRELVSEEVIKEPVEKIVAVGASAIERNPLTPSKGRNRYTVTLADGTKTERQETFYDLDMSIVVRTCGGSYSVREDGVKVDQDGYVLVAANLDRYPRCSVVETSLGAGKVYDTGTFALTNPEQFDIATDWTNHDGR